jgi:phosphatidylserine/phosphatidylglycerophosphate/cardiolipin synthase-like enzyme
VNTFATPVAHGTALTRVTPSSPVPDLRFKGDRLMWIGVPASTAISAFATGAVARAQGTSDGIPGNSGAAWTLLQLSPLPQMNPDAFKLVPGGLPVQLVLVVGTAGPTPAADDCIVVGSSLTTALADGAFLAFAFQDRLCRDPLTWAEAIAASGDCDPDWPQFLTDLAALPNARNLRILDHRGAPVNPPGPTAAGGSVSVSIDGGPAASVPFTNGMDGDTGIAVAATSRATVTFASTAHPIVASGDADTGTFEGSGLQLAVGARMAQILDAEVWLAAPDAGVQVNRWNSDSFLEPIQEGIPYFRRLVDDLHSAKPGGKAELAGWAFVKGSQADKTVDWALVPGDPQTTLLNLVHDLSNNGVTVQMLVNKFLRFDSPTLDDFPELGPILFGLYASLSPLQALLSIQTDPAGYVVGLLALEALEIVLASGVTLDLIDSIAEYSTEFMDALNDPAIATWTSYDAAFSDNPLVTPPPFKILGHTLDDISHVGVYHQKYVNVERADGTYVSYLGGIDINSDRLDTTIHRASHPFHDVQARITGPAVKDLILSFQERAHHHGADPPAIDPATVGPIAGTGSHLVQIARTYFKPGVGSPTTAFSFAPNGETTPLRSIKSAIEQARDYIYIEDQYFVPPDDYVDALVHAADSGARALMITMPYQADMLYGGRRRADVLDALQAAWGDRFYAGTPLRRFLHETPALTTNLGRMRLANPLTSGAAQCDLSPLAHIPPPPFWAFIGNELALAYAPVGGPSGAGDSAFQTLEIVRAAPTAWGATPVEHPAGAPVLAVQVPGVYVHAKVMIVDDTFLFVGSSNINRRGLYHDGEMNSFTIPQHLSGDPANPARILRTRLMAEHAGISAEMGQSLFADPTAALHYFTSRSWYEGALRQPLSFFGSMPTDVNLGTADTVGGWILHVLIGTAEETAMPDVWPLLVDPTTSLDPSPVKGPHYP